MPCLPPVTHLGLILKDNNLLASALSLRGSNYFRPFNRRCAYRYLIPIGNKQYFVQLNSIAFSRVQAVHLYRLARGYFILFATSFNNCVNLKPPKLRVNYTNCYDEVSNAGLQSPP